MASLEELRNSRIEKLRAFSAKGFDPFPARTGRTHRIGDALKSFHGLSEARSSVTLAGRIVGKRAHGAILFLDIADMTARLQFFVSAEHLKDPALYEFFETNLDMGDFIEGTGTLFITSRGEQSLDVQELKLLTKALRPIPETWYGLEDKEERLRRRYLDLLTHEETRKLFLKKNKFWQLIREQLVGAGFLEVETPVLEQVPGGADAEPFVTRYHALDTEVYLRISLELALKRLIVGGFERVFEIGRIFRNEGMDAEHLQDYTQLEFYWAYSDYETLMQFLEKMYKHVIGELMGGLQTIYDGKTIEWGDAWPRVEYFDIFKEHTGIDLHSVKHEALFEKAKSLGVKPERHWGKGKLIDAVFKRTCRPLMQQPSFLVHPPVEVEPLAKRKENDPSKVERFQVMAGGTELGKGFSELNDPLDQRARFEEQMRFRDAGDKEAQMLDEDFIEALEYGMPPTGGFGLSERLFAFLMDKPVRETVLFPAMRSKHD